MKIFFKKYHNCTVMVVKISCGNEEEDEAIYVPTNITGTMKIKYRLKIICNGWKTAGFFT